MRLCIQTPGSNLCCQAEAVPCVTTLSSSQKRGARNAGESPLHVRRIAPLRIHAQFRHRLLRLLRVELPVARQLRQRCRCH